MVDKKQQGFEGWDKTQEGVESLVVPDEEGVWGLPLVYRGTVVVPNWSATSRTLTP
jgi:hypothetical protein